MQQDASTSNASFSYRISGKRKYLENLRFATEPENKIASDAFMNQVWPEVNAEIVQHRQQLTTIVNNQQSNNTTMPVIDAVIEPDAPAQEPTIPAVAPMTTRNYPSTPAPNLPPPPTHP